MLDLVNYGQRSLTVWSVILLVCVAALVRERCNRLPPGPRGWPFLGILFDFPTVKPWEALAAWTKYGVVSSATLLGQTFVVINDADVGATIVGKGSTYADRPRIVMAEIAGFEHTVAAERYGPRHREYHKMMSRVIGTPTQVRRFHPAIEYHANRLMDFLAANTSSDRWDLCLITRKVAGAVVLHVAYGYTVDERPDVQDPFVELAERAGREFSYMATTGKFLVERVPILKHIPAWFPGAGFKHLALASVESSRQLHDMPFDWVEEQISKGTAPASFVHDLLLQGEVGEEERQDMKYAAASIYGAGTDTTSVAILSYFIAACRYPEVQSRLQEELDEVIGDGRLPGLEDRARLPYANAVTKECLRWLPIAPLALPHRATSSVVYETFSIPKGSDVITNIWAMLHDPKVYSKPMEFQPERFLGPSPAREPREVFGFGRRTCPGSHLADAIVFMMIARTAAVFTVKKAIDHTGKPITPTGFSSKSGAVPHPDPFPCRTEFRSPRSKALISDAR